MDDLRLEIDALKKRLAEMTAEAANNESILKRTQGRELTLLRADGLGPLLHAMVDGLRDSYGLDAVSVVLLDPQHEIRHLLIAGGDRPEEFKQIFFVDSLVGLAPQLAALHRPWLGPFVGADHHLLFPGSQNLKSAALLPLPRKDIVTGALCFGSRDPARFTRHHGTDFLAHLGAVAAVCIENAVNRARLLRAGITDFLTGWHNRRYLQQRMKEELARAQRRGATIACLMIDIDRFKGINDGYGHLAGDVALKEIAQRIESKIRSMDTAALTRLPERNDATGRAAVRVTATNSVTDATQQSPNVVVAASHRACAAPGFPLSGVELLPCDTKACGSTTMDATTSNVAPNAR